MISKRFENITRADIDALIENEIPEGRTLEYKRELAVAAPDQKWEFLKDVSALGNAAGGDLIIGVDQQDGIPVAAPGIPIDNADKTILSLENLIRDGLNPRLPVQIKTIPGFDNGSVLLIRVPQSWNAPHMITLRGKYRFWSRNSGGAVHLDTQDLRTAFTQSEALTDRIQRFRDERIARIIADETPVPLKPNPKVILHLIPIPAFASRSAIDLQSVPRDDQRLLGTLQQGWSKIRFNLDGLLTYSTFEQGPAESYFQLFRTGAIEACDAWALHQTGTQRAQIPGVPLEQRILFAATNYLELFNLLDVQTPHLLMLSLYGVKGYDVELPQRIYFGDPRPIDRDLLILPDTLLEDDTADLADALKPTFDALWQAGGFASSPSYDQNGRRK